MQTLTIKSVQKKPTRADPSKFFYIVTATDDTEVTTLDPNVLKLLPGTVIEAEIEVKGKYKNLEGFTVTKQGTVEPPPPEEKRTVPADNGREVSMAVSYIKDLMVAFVLPAEHPLSILAMSWCASRITATGIKPDDMFKPGKPPAMTKETGEAPKAATEAMPTQQSRAETWPKGFENTTIKDGTDLAIFAGKHGIAIDKFRTVLGVTKPQDVTKVKEAAHKLFPDGVT